MLSSPSSWTGQDRGSTYDLAISRTTRAIEQRAGVFRNHVIAVVLVFVAAALMAAVSHTWRALLLSSIVIPTSGFFFYKDVKAVNSWHSDLIKQWSEREIDFTALSSALANHPALPKLTITAMLEMLPSSESLTIEQQVSNATRRAVALVSLLHQQRQADALRLRTGLSAVVVVSITLALLTREWAALLGLALLLIVPVTSMLTNRARQNQLNAELEVVRNLAGFDRSDFERLARNAPYLRST